MTTDPTKKYADLYHKTLHAWAASEARLLMLAAEWEISGCGRAPAGDGIEARIYAECAAELRAILAGKENG